MKQFLELALNLTDEVNYKKAAAHVEMVLDALSADAVEESPQVSETERRAVTALCGAVLLRLTVPSGIQPEQLVGDDTADALLVAVGVVTKAAQRLGAA